MGKPKIIVILGPTASGKSELAVQIAKCFSDPSRIKSNMSRINGAEIISADSRQVYKGLDIGSGKVPRDKLKVKNLKLKIKNKKNYYYKGIKHYLLDVASPKKTFTVAQYQKLAKKALQKILKKGKIPIVCGGTGFYIDALIYDYQLPAVSPQPKLRKQLEKKSTEELFKKLQKLDPQRAKNIDKHNRRRLIRALEIIIKTKKPIPFLKKNPFSYHVLILGIKKEKEELKKLINKRLLKRLKQGMVEEVKKLRKSGVSWKRLEELGLEYRFISQYLQKKIKYNEMLERLQREIEGFAKRQMTWFKRNRKIIWINNLEEAFSKCEDWLGL